ncbi:MAG: hypothetical protein RLZZ618_1029 [Pseudomonadota bacterium]|jgi:3-oxoacyl-[acyl-carrier-protein] synthase-1
MTITSLAVRQTGLVTSVGLDAPSSCAAIRAKLTNPVETRFVDGTGNWLMAHEIPLAEPWRGLDKLARIAAMAIEECLDSVPRAEWPRIPLLLCVAERERPGRLDGLDDRLFAAVEDLLKAHFSSSSVIITHGRVSAAVALAAAHKLLDGPDCTQVVVAACDSLLHWPSLSVFESKDRLLTETNSNGFMAGEAAGAVLLGRPGTGPELRCTSVGFGVEPAPIDSGEPFRGEGLALAIRQALDDSGRKMHEMDLRIADLSGEQYYFKEAALSLSRTMTQTKEFFDLWHPAESIGETGAASGLAVLAALDAACRKGYAPGRRAVAHFANDGGQRAAAIFEYAGAA